MSAPRLSSATVAREAISPPERAEMLALMQVCYEGVDPTRFFADLDDKQYVIMLYGPSQDGGGRELAGFSTIALRQEQLHGEPVEVLFSGDTVIHPRYWGQKVLDAAFWRFLLSRKLAHPRRKLFWLLLSAGYKTYLMIVNYFPLAFPRRGTEPPFGQRAFLDGLASRWWGDHYDAARGVMHFDNHYHVRAGVSPVDDVAKQNPDVAFFAERNPDHVQGHELVCLAEIRTRDLFAALARIVGRRGLKPLKRARHSLRAWAGA